MAGLLETLQNLRFNPSPLSTGLMLGGANMMQAGGPSLQPQNFGSAMGAGLQGLLQGYVGAQDAQTERDMRKLMLQRQLDNDAINSEYHRAQIDHLKNPNKYAAATPGQWYIPPGAKEENFGGLKGFRTPDGAFIPNRAAATEYQTIMTDPDKLAPIAEAKKRGEGFGTLVDRETPEGTQKGFYGDFAGTNPGNLRVPGKQEFQQFGSRQEGLNAIEKQLALYGDRGINTLSAIASTWAPPNENDTPQYIKNLATFTGYRPDAALNLKDPVVLRALSSAISRQEGAKVYDQGGLITGPTKAQQKAVDAAIEVQTAIGKKQGEGALENQQALIKRARDANDVISTLNQAAPIVGRSTGSGLGAMADSVAGFFGHSTQGAEAADQLRVLEGDLIAKMPKMSGPQSDRDALLYKQMAAQVGDPTIPIERKQKAMQALAELQAKYAGIPAPTLNFSGGEMDAGDIHSQADAILKGR